MLTTLYAASLSLLTSRRTSLVTVYDFSRTNDNLLRMCGSPYALPPIIKPDGRHLGHAVFQEPNISGAKRISWLQLSERGSVSLLDLEHLSVDDDRIQPDMAPRKAEWPPDVEALEAASRAKPDLGPLAARAHSIVNLHPAYRREEYACFDRAHLDVQRRDVHNNHWRRRPWRVRDGVRRVGEDTYLLAGRKRVC